MFQSVSKRYLFDAWPFFTGFLWLEYEMFWDAVNGWMEIRQRGVTVGTVFQNIVLTGDFKVQGKPHAHTYTLTDTHVHTNRHTHTRTHARTHAHTHALSAQVSLPLGPGSNTLLHTSGETQEPMSSIMLNTLTNKSSLLQSPVLIIVS